MTTDSTWTTVSSHTTSIGRIAYQRNESGQYRVVERRFNSLAPDGQ
ncbi:hypothetical protein JVX90_02645 [Gordonia sp. PDNC005]|nr:hypothetical protein [Gordonia sp. PDNC005]QRY63163.1 hypothetical protein JVX90_02645 [Gordonia sp. PDNC005]